MCLDVLVNTKEQVHYEYSVEDFREIELKISLPGGSEKGMNYGLGAGTLILPCSLSETVRVRARSGVNGSMLLGVHSGILNYYQ